MLNNISPVNKVLSTEDIINAIYFGLYLKIQTIGVCVNFLPPEKSLLALSSSSLLSPFAFVPSTFNCIDFCFTYIPYTYVAVWLSIKLASRRDQQHLKFKSIAVVERDFYFKQRRKDQE